MPFDDTTLRRKRKHLERLSKNKYGFRQIPKDNGRNRPADLGSNRVTPETRVRLTGEVITKQQGRANDVDVRYLEIVK